MADTVYPLCAVGCPVNTDTRLIGELISKGEYEKEMDLLPDANPFSSVRGTICSHPCEQNCRRANLMLPSG